MPGIRVRRLSWLLIVLLGAAASQAQLSDLETAQEQLASAYSARDWPQAIEAGKKLAELDPTSANIAYNLACVLALGGKPDEAMTWLERSTELGFDQPSLMAGDPDLASLRQRDGYKALLGRVERTEQKNWKTFVEQAKRAPVVIEPPPSTPKGQALPTLVVLHPYNGQADGFLEHWRLAAAKVGVLLVAPQAVNPVGEGYSWGSARQTWHLVQRALEKAAESHRIDAKRVMLTGFSQGGFMTWALGLSHPETFRGIIPCGGTWNPGAAPLPEKATAVTPRVYAISGSDDMAFESSGEAVRGLAAAGARSEFKVFEGLGHVMPADSLALAEALEWVLAD